MTRPLYAPIGLEAVIFDWAGTLVDFGSLAPTQIFVEAFKSFNMEISLQQARGPMGLSKWQHIRTLLDHPEVASQWQERHGSAPADTDVDAIYARFMPMQIAKVGDYSQAITGAADTLVWLRSKGLKIGSCSGYPRQVLDVLLPLAAAEGIVPDHVIAGDELSAGAGMWMVGVSLSGNEVGCTREKLALLTQEQIKALKALAEMRLRNAGAHYVIDSVADLPEVAEDVARRLQAGERP